VICGSCGAQNRAGRKFCGECGSPLALGCPACGAANEPGEKFCGECGSALVEGARPAPRVVAVEDEPAPPVAERRLVSVLFADLVGFTTLSESRDPEEVRDLLSRYFDTCRTLIERYGGVVEKFIGDAVMAVWGTPVATEHDAERAVRAALDLTAAVAALGEESGAPELAARAGVLTGEAAVNLGAEGQGMVAGDLVNTASRIQSAAAPGSVFVGEATKRASEETVVFEDAGTFELKGKAEPVPLFRAIRIVSGTAGSMRSAGLEAPFVGRDRELRMIKDLFHASAEQRRTHLVTVLAPAGTGKSRMVWEFFKYIDGLAETVRWHRGRCLPYGEGVTYWALAEMLRTRAGIIEGEEPAEALPKLRQALEESVSDAEERAWIEPRVAHLLGLEDRVAREREDLFAAWRLLYERLAEEMPTVMVFEDLQWADPSLLDFIQYLLEWSREHRLFVLAVGRPELMERRPTWGTASRNATSLRLEPLPVDAMGSLLDGLAPGLPEELRATILERAEGVPLYAVETVRMLIDRGVLELEGSAYRLAGSVEALAVPETLHALIAARLDGLSTEERRVVQDGSVLGKTFTTAGLSLLSGLTEEQLAPLLASLVRKEVFFLQADPLSPERGQHGFLQDLVKLVAYETLSKKERKAKHLAAARNAEETPDAEELAEVIAAHYVEAYRAAPEAPDAAEIKVSALSALERAGERAASLAATFEAQRLFDHAAELADDDVRRAGLLERAGRMAHWGARYPEAAERLERAASLFEGNGESRLHAKASAALAETQWYGMGRIEEPLGRMEAAYEILSSGERDETLAALAGEIARFQYFAGHVEASLPWIERALDIAEALWLPEVLSNVLNTKALARRADHPEESFALLERAVVLAEENGYATALIRAINNLGVFLAEADRTDEALETFARQEEIAHRLGIEQAVLVSRVSTLGGLVELGRWEELDPFVEDLWPERERAPRDVVDLIRLVLVHRARGEADRGRAILDAFAGIRDSDEAQMRAAYHGANACQLLAEKRVEDALAASELAIADAEIVGINSDPVKWAYTYGMEAAVTTGDFVRLEDLIVRVESVPKGLRSPYLGAQATRYRALLGAVVGDGDPSASWKAAAGAFREIGASFWLGVTLVEHGEWLAEQDRPDAAPYLVEALQIMQGLRATPWLERIEAAMPAEARATS
jgi:class 3 adenylate cyclase/tetratricopeptide (TPR) repeat protein